MNFIHAFGFLVVGVISGLLPRWVPSLCPVNGVDGSSAQAIWLQLMSAVQVGIAGLYFIQRVCSWLNTVMPYTAPEFDTAVHAPRPAVPANAAPAWRQTAIARERARGAVLPVGLLDQRQAA